LGSNTGRFLPAAVTGRAEIDRGVGQHALYDVLVRLGDQDVAQVHDPKVFELPEGLGVIRQVIAPQVGDLQVLQISEAEGQHADVVLVQVQVPEVFHLADVPGKDLYVVAADDQELKVLKGDDGVGQLFQAVLAQVEVLKVFELVDLFGKGLVFLFAERELDHVIGLAEGFFQVGIFLVAGQGDRVEQGLGEQEGLNRQT
jgi:hypothetical protein